MANQDTHPQHQHRKLLVQMSGAPGSGKSTTAKLIAPALNAIILDHDIIRSSILEDASIPFSQAATLAYRLQQTLAESLLKQHQNLIIDSPCFVREILDRGTALAGQYGYEYWYIETRTDDIDLLDERLRNRPALRSQRTGVSVRPVDAKGPSEGVVDEDARALFRTWIEDLSRPDPDRGHNVVVVDAAGDLDARREMLLKWIGVSIVESSSVEGTTTQ